MAVIPGQRVDKVAVDKQRLLYLRGEVLLQDVQAVAQLE